MNTERTSSITGYKPFNSLRDAMLELSEVGESVTVFDYASRLNQSLYYDVITDAQHTLLYGDLFILMSRNKLRLFEL